MKVFTLPGYSYSITPRPPEKTFGRTNECVQKSHYLKLFFFLSFFVIICNLWDSIAPGIISFLLVSIIFLILFMHIRLIRWTSSGKTEIIIILTKSRSAQEVADVLSWPPCCTFLRTFIPWPIGDYAFLTCNSSCWTPVWTTHQANRRRVCNGSFSFVYCILFRNLGLDFHIYICFLIGGDFDFFGLRCT